MFSLFYFYATVYLIELERKENIYSKLKLSYLLKLLLKVPFWSISPLVSMR